MRPMDASPGIRRQMRMEIRGYLASSLPYLGRQTSNIKEGESRVIVSLYLLVEERFYQFDGEYIP